MQLQKTLFYIALMFALCPTLDLHPALGSTSDCHVRVRDVYFSTLLRADDRWVCDICEIGEEVNSGFIGFTTTDTILSGKYPVPSVFGATPVIPYLTVPGVVWDAPSKSGTIVFGTIETIRGLPNPLVMELLVPWETDLEDFWARARWVGWQARQQKAGVDAANDRVRGIDKIREHATYRNAVAGFHESLFLDPEDPIAYVFRATAKLALGDAESALGNAEQAQRYYHDAIQDYTEVLDRAPENTDNTDGYVLRSYAKFRLGTLASALGNAEQAQRLYHAAIADCHQALALYRKDDAALKAALSIHTAVVQDRKGAIGLRNRYAFVYYLQGLGKQALGEHTAADADFRKAKGLQRMPESGCPLAPNLGRRTGEGW